MIKTCMYKCLNSISDINLSKLGFKMMAYKKAATLKSIFCDFCYFFSPKKALFASFTKTYVVRVINRDADIIFMLIQP